MNVRPRKFTPSRKVVNGKPTPKVEAQPVAIPAPIAGWNLAANIADPQPLTARLLDNWACETDGIRARGGSQKFATVASAAACTGLVRYKSGAIEKLFATTADSIFDISGVADPDVIPTADVSGQTDDYYSHEQFGTAGGDFLYMLNGSDKPQLYDGSTWTAIDGVSSPAITGVTTTELSHVWSFGSRLFFVRKDTMEAYYLPVDSVGGAASVFSLAGIFQSGGALSFGARWSLDAGDGLDDKCIFVSTEGEIAVYEGTNPGDANNWRKVGVYQVSPPLGPNATIQIGGDLLIATQSGLVPMSKIIQRDITDLDNVAHSRNINPYWQQQAAALSEPWELVRWPEKNQILISQPGAQTTSMLIANAQTIAWSRYTGTDAQCLGYFNGTVYYGTRDGEVFELESGGDDDGTPYTCSMIGTHERYGTLGQKTAQQVRASYQTSTDVTWLITFNTDYDETLAGAPAASAPSGTDIFDVGLWDTAVWDGQEASPRVLEWRSIGRTGFSLAPQVQLTIGGTDTPKTTLALIELTMTGGSVVN